MPPTAVLRFVLLLLVALPAAWAEAAETVVAARQRLDKTFSTQLNRLAASCEAQGLTDAADRTRLWFPPDAARALLLFDPAAANSAMPAKAAPDLAAWHKQFTQLRNEQAKNLYALARTAAQEEQVSLTLELVAAALREDPDHADARRVLGYVHHEGAWHTNFSRARQEAGQVWHPRFGWLPQAQVVRYEAGERYHRGRWISAEHDARLHSQIDTPWELRTEHYDIATNHSLEAAARFATQLERVYFAWHVACGGYTTSPLELTRLMEGEARKVAALRRHQVVVFRNRSEFQQALRGEVPENVSITGIYIPRRRTAYFFVPDAMPGVSGPAFDDTVLFHEAVHQLFQETRTSVPEPAVKQYCWLIEGIACYFESLAVHDGYMSLGAAEAGRLNDARIRLIRDNFYVPLAEFSAMGRDTLQRDPRIAQLYTQSAGLAHFFMHAQQGRYRDSLITVLQALYSGRDRPGTLPEAMNEDVSTLDAQYLQFMREAVE